VRVLTYGFAGAFLLAVLLGLGLTIQTQRLKAVKAEYAQYQAGVKAQGELAIKANKAKEAQYAKNIKSAVAGRDAALKRLRDSAGSSAAPISPKPPAGSDQLCFDPPAFAAAVEAFRSGVQGIVTEGDAAQIDAESLVQAWPNH